MVQTKSTTYGKELRRIRREERYSLRHLADALGVSSSYISDVERGTKNPLSRDSTIKVLQFMGREEELPHLMHLEAFYKKNVQIPLDDKAKEIADTIIMLRNKDHEGTISIEDWKLIRNVLEGGPSSGNTKSSRKKSK